MARQPFGGSESPDEAQELLIHRARREVLEKAGAYLEGLPFVRDLALEKDEILALAAGVLEAKITGEPKPYLEGNTFGMTVLARVVVDHSTIETRARQFLRDRTLLEKYKETLGRGKELLKRIEELNEALKYASSEEREGLRQKFEETTKGLTAIGWCNNALALRTNQPPGPDVNEKALEYLNKAIHLDQGCGVAYALMGWTYDDTGDYDKAIEYYQKSLEFGLKEMGPGHPGIAVDYNNLASAYMNKGDYDKAIEYYQKSLEFGLKEMGPEHPGIAVDYDNLASAYMNKGDYDKAIEYYQKSLEFGLKEMGPEHPGVAVDYNNLGSAYKGKGDYNSAKKYYKKALKIGLKRLGTDHPYTKIFQENLDSFK